MSAGGVLPVVPVSPDVAVDVLHEAFHEYPVMRFVLGTGDGYDARLRKLVGFFVDARLLRREPILGILDPDTGNAAGVALAALPDRLSPAALGTLSQKIWRDLGGGARARYNAYSAAAGRFAVPAPHHHLNMVGVRRSRQGQGVARWLIEHVHELARLHPISTGVALNTESPGNVALYLHLGYQLIGHAPVGDGLETWAFFRPTPHFGLGDSPGTASD